MTREVERDPQSMMSRRTLVQGLAVAAGATAAGASGALAQQPAAPLGPPSTITTPPRDFGPGGAPTTDFWDPDIIALDPSFNDLAQPNTVIKRLDTGSLWAEGPAWSSQGRYLLWSDIPNNRQMRWLDDDGRVTVFRTPSNNSNGNSFDFQGRQLSCEHLARRVVRYEHYGTSTVLADNFGGKKLNSPNDVVAHPDGSYWFTDPPYGGQLTRASRTVRAVAPCRRQAQSADWTAGRLRAEQARAADHLLPHRSFWPPRRVVTEDQVPDPNGLCFSPDYKKLYVASTGKGPGDTGPGGKGDMSVFDVGTDDKLSNGKRFPTSWSTA